MRFGESPRIFSRHSGFLDLGLVAVVILTAADLFCFLRLSMAYLMHSSAGLASRESLSKRILCDERTKPRISERDSVPEATGTSGLYWIASVWNQIRT